MNSLPALGQLGVQKGLFQRLGEGGGAKGTSLFASYHEADLTPESQQRYGKKALPPALALVVDHA